MRKVIETIDNKGEKGEYIGIFTTLLLMLLTESVAPVRIYSDGSGFEGGIWCLSHTLGQGPTS